MSGNHRRDVGPGDGWKGGVVFTEGHSLGGQLREIGHQLQRYLGWLETVEYGYKDALHRPVSYSPKMAASHICAPCSTSGQEGGFRGGVERPHTDAHRHCYYAPLHEYVGVRPAAGGFQYRLQAQPGEGASDQTDCGVVLDDVVGLIGVHDVQGNPGVGVAGRGFVKHLAELTLHPGQLFVAAASELSVQHGRFRDDVPLQSGFHTANVGGRLGIDAAQGQAVEYVRRHQHGGQPFFGLQTGVGGPSRNVRGHHVLGRRGHRHPVGRSLPVEDDA